MANHSKHGLATVANSFWKPEHTQTDDCKETVNPGQNVASNAIAMEFCK